MRYPEASRLPLNASAVDDRLRPATPGEPDAGEAGRWILFSGGALLFDAAARPPSPLLAGLPAGVARPDRSVLMGAWDGQPLRIAELPRGSLPSGLRAAPLLHLVLGELLDDPEVTLAGRAQQILAWEGNSAVCSRCGGRPEPIPGTWGKRCGGCGREQFPHVHPCALVLVRRGHELLLVRKPDWPEGYYSLPSGFCDFGESLEECACREVREETGIRIRGLRYVGSQSWPFPSQLMMAFTAEYAGGEVAVDRGELEDARWFATDALPATFSARSIAGWMLEVERARARPASP